MKKTVIIGSVVLVTLIAATVIQFRMLPTDVWSSIANVHQNYHGYLFSAEQGHLPEQLGGSIEIKVDASWGLADNEYEITSLVSNVVAFDYTNASVGAVSVKSTSEVTWLVSVPVPAANAGHHIVGLALMGRRRGGELFGLHLDIPVDISPSKFHRVWLSLLIFLILSVVEAAILGLVLWRRRKIRNLEVKIEKAEAKVEQEPTKAKPAWDLARVKLEAYFDRNLFQVNQVFWLAVVMMMVGFGFVLAAVVMSLNQTYVIPAAKVAGLSGVITQFIGATFLVIYKSTMAQANEFMSVLERINTVGMAVQVLDSIPETNAALKDKTRAEIVALLLSANVPKKLRTDKV